jgi:sugar O-acyltransferase (sialic acid O-acetyltransferase NeuD family)
MKLYGIIGAGGFAREVMPVARDLLLRTQAAQDFELVFVTGQGDARLCNGQRVMTEQEFLAADRDKYFNIAIADHRIRQRVARTLIDAGARPFAITAHNSMNLSANQIGPGAILCPFSMVTADATIGSFFHANIYSYVAHDCRIGDFVTFAPRVQCNGRVIVEDGATIGCGAIIRDGTEAKPIVIGRGAVVGMGAVVTRSVAPFTTVVGNPAAPLKEKADSVLSRR